jgi:argininosuccinate lyase
MTLIQENVNRSLGNGHLTATDLADFLAMHGVPFRDAHEITGKIVRDCEDRKVDTTQLKVDDLVKFHPAFKDAPADIAGLRASIHSRKSLGGTAPERVREALAEAKEALGALVRDVETG